MCISVHFGIRYFCFIIDEHRHSVAGVEVQDAGLTGLPDPRAAADLLDLVEPEREDHWVPGSSVHVKQKEIDSTDWSCEPPSFHI